MIKKIIVSEKRNLFPCGWTFGTTLEKNVTSLKFIVPPTLEYLKDKYLLLVNSSGPFKLKLDNNNEILLDSIVTGDTEAQIQLILCNKSREIWRSRSYGISFYPSLDETMENPIVSAVNQNQEELREKLAEASEKFFGGDYSKVSFDDMTEQISSAAALNAGEITVEGVSFDDREILPSEGKNAISKATVKALEKRMLKVTKNGIYPNEIPSENPDGSTEAIYYTDIEVNIPDETNLTDFSVKPLREAKTYTAADSDKISTTGKPFTGINSLTVEAADAAIDSNIVPNNIRQGTEILGTQGSLIPLEGEYQERLDEWEMVKSAIEQMPTWPNLLSINYGNNADGSIKLVKLPYLPTKNVTSGGLISDSIEECGFDVSNYPTAGNGMKSGIFRQNAKNLKRVKVTGMQSVNNLTNFFTGQKVEEVELYQDGGFEHSGDYFYQEMFSYCSNLIAIKGDPLDLSVSGFSCYSNMFNQALKLRYVRFKPGTINGDIPFNSNADIWMGSGIENETNPGTLLSILNGIRPYTGLENAIKVTFNQTIKAQGGYLDIWHVKLGDDGLFVISENSADMTLREAFTSKDVSKGGKNVVIA